LGKRAARSRPDVIVASGDCFIGLYALRLARKTGARFVFDVYDDYRAFGAYRVFANFNTFEYLCKRANHILFASRVLAECMVIDTPWTLIPNGVDPSVFCPMDRAQARAAIGLADDGTRWIGYFGGMEAERGAVDLVAAVGQLCVHNPAIRLLLCGPQSSDVLLDAPWVEHHGMVPHEKIPLYINACDVVVLPYRRGPIIDMASSVKIAEYLFCERPIVATRTPNLIKNFEKQAAELGEAICAPGDATDLARAINAQLHHPVVASSPVKHTWDAIAKRALSALRVP
jgi:glycosyltransferase involved in cell wall biosynthesis